MTSNRLTGLTAACLLALMAPPAIAEVVHDFNLPQQPLADSLREIGRQTAFNILFQPETVEWMTAPAVQGRLSPQQAVERALTGSGLLVEQTATNTLLVREADGQGNAFAGAEEAFDLHTIEVTGTRLRNSTSTSPVISFDRRVIEDNGFSTLQDLMRRVPQNFNSTTGATGTGGGNVGLTTQIDLRGLGSQSTLTLVNGRRVASAAGNQGRAFDISMIPVAAISRVDILTDGASALYGSDAIGGVVNVMLRRDFHGAESTVQYGVGKGSADSLLVSQLLGHSWNSGYFMAAAQYDRRDAATMASSGLTSTDHRFRGGGDYRQPGFGNPGTVYPAGYFAGLPFSTITGPDGGPVYYATLPPGDGLDVPLDQLGLNQMTHFDPMTVDLAPTQENRSLYVTFEQDIGPVTLFADATYAKREGEQRLNFNATYLDVPVANAYNPFSEPVMVGYVLEELGPVRVWPGSEGWMFNLGGRGEVGDSGWNWEVVGSRSRDEFTSRFVNLDFAELSSRLASPDPAHAFNPFGDGSAQVPGLVEALTAEAAFSGISSLHGLSAQLEGALATLPGGELRLAFGAEYREEELNSRVSGGGQPEQVLFPNATRDASALFAEAYLPLFGAANARPGLQELGLSIAGRHDRYSDFGNTTNPKIGVLWRASRELAMKANWGTSFRAPALRELYMVQQFRPDYPVLDPNAPDGPENVFVDLLSGGNPELEPEEAETYTVSAEYRPGWLPGARIGVGYFNTDYSHRIRPANEGSTEGFLFSIEDQLPPGIIQREADGRLQALNFITINSAATRMAGWDVDIGYGWSTPGGSDFDLSLAATVLDRYDDRVLPGAPQLERKGTSGNPPDWRGRLGLAWRQDAWSANLGLNFIESMENSRVDPRVQTRYVNSQSTMDVQVGFTPTGVTGSDFRSGLSVRLGVNNLFDRKPPFVDGPNGLDARNHVYEGRFVYLRVSKAFGNAL